MLYNYLCWSGVLLVIEKWLKQKHCVICFTKIHLGCFTIRSVGGGPEKGNKFRIFDRPIFVGSHPCDTRWKLFEAIFVISGIFDLTQISKRFPPLVLLIFILANLHPFGTPLVGRIPGLDKNPYVFLGHGADACPYYPATKIHPRVVRPHAARAHMIAIIKGSDNLQQPHNNFARENTSLFPTARVGDLDSQRSCDNHTTPHPLSFSSR